ncbi:lipocalin family protein [Larkinella insperata]|uniref:Lipocalin family protein n=1 Tax=Larkinella insperata TaxID=332158 RepID=A0ABW3Q871_9BACT|nr:lipocalin family protein [Larkinella insperata]
MKSLLHTLAGTWFICSTNFPMWLKGDKTHPTFTYTVVQKDNDIVLLDEVRYLKNGSSKTLIGYDYPDKTDPMGFVWRGKGFLRIAKSNWKVALLDPAGQWAVIWFSKTLFTPEGVDIISRTAKLSPETLRYIHALMEKDPLLKKQLPTLKAL